MDIQSIEQLIENLGFPIVIALAACFVIYKLLNKMIMQSEEHFKELQIDCKTREEKLYVEIKENREINSKAIDTIAKYAEKLDVIQDDIDDIKTNITVLATKVK